MLDKTLNLKNIKEFIKSPLILDDLIIKNRLALAPLAGTTEVVFRSLCSSFDVGLTTTELVSARGICYDSKLKLNYRYLEINPLIEQAVAIQLFGHDQQDFARATQTVLQHPVLGQCAMIDINMGCPVKKVVKQGAGSALMKTPELAKRIVSSTAEVAQKFKKQVSVKIRAGWDEGSRNAPEFAEMLQQAGAALITVHARTRDQMYSGNADWNIIKQVVQQVSIPVYGNGDLIDFESIAKMYRQTGCAGFAIGRAAVGNPWIFSRILHDMPEPDNNELLRVIDCHLTEMIKKIGDESVAVKKMRPQLVSYFKGKRNAAILRNAVMNSETKSEIYEILKSLG